MSDSRIFFCPMLHTTSAYFSRLKKQDGSWFLPLVFPNLLLFLWNLYRGYVFISFSYLNDSEISNVLKEAQKVCVFWCRESKENICCKFFLKIYPILCI